MKVRQKAAKRVAIEICRPEIRRSHADRGARRREELRQVAPIRADSVRRQVAVQPQEPQERVKIRGHARAVVSARASIQAASDCRARSASAVLRASFAFGARASGSMMPNVMFDGS